MTEGKSPPGNPNMAEINMGTRFGAANGPDPSEAAMKAKPWSIRNAMRYWACQGYDLTKPSNIDKLLVERGSQLTAAQVIALRAVQRAMTKDGDAQFVTENIEGKLPQTNLNAELDLSEEERDAEYKSARDKLKRGLARLAARQLGEPGSDAGGDEPTGGGPPKP